MTIPKFSLSSGLLGIALLAVWLASSQVQEYSSAIGLRSIIWFVVFAIAVLSVVHYRGSSRAFWIGFTFALFMKSPPTFLEPYAPKLYLSNLIANQIATPGQHWHFMWETLNLVLTLILCLVCGVISRIIYLAGQQSENDGKRDSQR